MGEACCLSSRSPPSSKGNNHITVSCVGFGQSVLWDIKARGATLVKEYKVPVIRPISSGDLRYSIVIMVNNTVLYT